MVKKSLTFVESATSLLCSKDPHNGVFNANEILKGCERGFPRRGWVQLLFVKKKSTRLRVGWRNMYIEGRLNG